MKLRRLRLRCMLIAALMAVYVFVPVVSEAAEWGDITINEHTFPDPVFRQWLLDPDNLEGSGSDGKFTKEELASITQLHFERGSGESAASLQGIEYFSSLKELSVSGHSLTELDLSANRELEYLYCKYNQLRVLNIKDNPNLRVINCHYNMLRTLNLAQAPELEVLIANNNLLETLDLEQNQKLKLIEAFDNRLTSIDVSNLPDLKFLNIGENRLTELDMRSNAKLEDAGFAAEQNNLKILHLPNLSGRMISIGSFYEQTPIEGYDTVEWYLDAQYKEKVSGKELAANGQTLYAKKIANSYTIQYSPNGGTGVMASQSAEFSKEIALSPNAFSRRGYTFTGWNRCSDGSGKAYEDKAQVQNLAGKSQGEEVTLYAQWAPIQYKIRYDKNSESATGSMDESTVSYDKNIKLSENQFEDSLYDFAGWAVKPDGSVAFSDQSVVRNLAEKEGETVTLYAVWRLKPEEAQRPFLEELRRAFEAYDNSDYTAEDWNSMIDLYEEGQSGIAEQGSDTSAISAYTTQTIEKMDQVKTQEERLSEIETGWTQEHKEALDLTGQIMKNASHAKKVLEKTEEALTDAETEHLAQYSTLKETGQAYELASQIQEQISPQVNRLQDLEKAAGWFSDTEEYHLLSNAGITSAHKENLAALIESYNSLSSVQSDYISKSAVTELENKFALADKKAAATETLKANYESYDKERYSDYSLSVLKKEFDEAVRAVEAAANEGTVQSLTQSGQAAMKAVDPAAVQPEIQKPQPEKTQPQQQNKPSKTPEKQQTSIKVSKPKTPSLKLKAGKKKMKLSWKKVNGVAGYEIYEASRKNGTFKKVKKLGAGKSAFTKKYQKGNKKYYYKMRSYKIVNGKKIYSSYSPVKSGKVK